MRATIALLVGTALTLGFSTGSVRADFPVAETVHIEASPSVAYNTVTDEFAVAYLYTDTIGTYVLVRLFDPSGTQQGSDIWPFGTGLQAIARPEIIYNPDLNQYLVAAIGSGSSTDEIAVRRVDADGNVMTGPDFLFTGLTNRRFAALTNVNPIRIAYNTTLEEYVVIVCLDNATSGQQRTIYGQRFAGDTSWFGSVVNMSSHTLDFQVWSYSIAHAPVAGTTGGHYLFGYSWDTQGQSQLQLLDAALTPIVNPIPFEWGTPVKQAGYADVAFGRVEGVERFLVVWSDGNNTYGPPQWTGIWGSYLDPAKTSYTTTPENTPMPISFIPFHPGTFQYYKPRVAHNRSAQAFFVAWNERPSNHPDNQPDMCTHIRATWVDYLTFDVAYHPHANQVISDVTCNCVPGSGDCLSSEDPHSPDVAPLGSGGAVVVWQQNYPPFPSDQDLKGDTFGYVRPANDDWTNPEEILPPGGLLECNLLGATLDGGSSCGGSGEPDVWYSFTAPTHGELRTATCGTHDRFGMDTGMDSVLSLHEPAHADQIDFEACNDDFSELGAGDLCEGADTGMIRDSVLGWRMVAGQELLVRVSRYEGSTGGFCNFFLEFAEGVGGAGHLPQDGFFTGGAPLTVEKLPGGEVHLRWDVSCAPGDEDFAVYEGELGFWDTHEPKACSTSGQIELPISPEPGNRYFLVVPQNGTFEGSYGMALGGERWQGRDICYPQFVNTCP